MMNKTEYLHRMYDRFGAVVDALQEKQRIEQEFGFNTSYEEAYQYLAHQERSEEALWDAESTLERIVSIRMGGEEPVDPIESIGIKLPKNSKNHRRATATSRPVEIAVFQRISTEE